MTTHKQRSPRPVGVGVRVALVAFRRRLLDPDAVAFAFKPLTDAVARSLGVDDADQRVAWEWRQVETRGAEGVAVVVQVEIKTCGNIKQNETKYEDTDHNQQGRDGHGVHA